jgi:hypothetical protein
MNLADEKGDPLMLVNDSDLETGCYLLLILPH